jgi:hypothetical protein
MVFGVLGEVAMCARLLDETGRRRAFHGFQVIDLILEGFVPPRCHRYSFHGLSIPPAAKKLRSACPRGAAGPEFCELSFKYLSTLRNLVVLSNERAPN